MDSIPKGARVEICTHCTKKWIVSKLAVIAPGAYECPICESERKRRDAK